MRRTGIEEAGRRRLSPQRVAAGLALAAWASLFWWLMAAGLVQRYLSSRVDWVVPVGAVLLTIGALGRLASARTSRPEGLHRRDVLVLGVVVLPVVAVLALPQASLGSYAVERRSDFARAGFVASPDTIDSGELTLLDVAGAQQSREAMEALVRRAGSRVSFVGFVTRYEETPPDEFVLTRFIISCCVADALSAQVRVVDVPPGEFEQDQWVRVTGAIYPLGSEVLLDASEVEAIAEPRDPYLSP
jgi:putative membrane protein